MNPVPDDRVPVPLSQQLLLGFDARLGSPADPLDWNEHRRDRYLLRRDVSRPISTDVAVWPTIFDSGVVPRPSFVGPYQDLWEDLAALTAHLDTAPARPRASIVAISLRYDACTDAEKTSWDRLLAGFDPLVGPEGQSAPPATSRSTARGDDWDFLGYDVSDQGGLSALSNCAFDPGESEALRRRWQPRINAHHLFADLQDALDFRDTSNRRVTEHAPFFVFGIWLIETR